MSNCKSSASTFDSAIAYALFCLKLEDFTLKAEQLEAVKLLSQGHDVFVWFPNGFGKSICYQVLPFVFDVLLNRTNSLPTEQSVVVVVSPLVSLMVDQVKTLQAHGVGAAIMSSSRGIDKSLTATEYDISVGKYRLLYSSPEAVVGDHSSGWTKMLLSPPLCSSLVAIAVDEAHCVYKW